MASKIGTILILSAFATILGLTNASSASTYTFKGEALVTYGEGVDGNPISPITSASDCYIAGLTQQAYGFVPKNTSWVALSSTRGGEVNILSSNGEVIGVGSTKVKMIDEITCAVTFSVKVPKSNFYKIRFIDGTGTQPDFTYRKSIPFSVVSKKKTYKFDTSY
jgi:hypothetical protein